jgi:hypothetical protein
MPAGGRRRGPGGPARGVETSRQPGQGEAGEQRRCAQVAAAAVQVFPSPMTAGAPLAALLTLLLPA